MTTKNVTPFDGTAENYSLTTNTIAHYLLLKNSTKATLKQSLGMLKSKVLKNSIQQKT